MKMLLCIVLILFSTNFGFVTDIEPPATESNSYCDQFDSPDLNPSWAWIDPLGDSNFDLTSNPGHLRLFTPDGNHDLFQNFNAPRMVQAINGDFIVSTKVTISLSHIYQGAGLLIWQDNNNFVRMERASGEGINRVSKVGGVYNDINPDFPVDNMTVYLRFQRSGETILGFFSENKVNWQQVYEVSFPSKQSLYVGLSLLNQYQNNPIWADFDFFETDDCGSPISTKNFLPISLNNHIFFFKGPWEQEDNDVLSQANGPLSTGKDYFGHHDDRDDYYSFLSPNPGQIIIDMSSEHIVRDKDGTPVVQLQLFYQSLNRMVDYYVGPDARITYQGLPGWYYARIYTVPEFINESKQYLIQASFP